MFDLETVETCFLALQFTLCTCITYRFGGGEFPPMIFFKVFLHSEGKGVKYLSGKRVIKPATGVSILDFHRYLKEYKGQN